jgi:hypothetical protein
MGTDEICKFSIEWSPLQDLFDQDEDLNDTLIQSLSNSGGICTVSACSWFTFCTTSIFSLIFS